MIQSNLSKISAGKVSNPILVSCRESIMETKQSFYGKFYIGPLSVGQGLTVANALRRTLLSELVGLAITSVSIEGVTHEYSTLKGVRESVLDVLLNLKQIVLKSKQSLRRPQTAYIYFQGPGVIRAADLILPPSIQCVDPEQYIATVSSDGFLKMKLIIRQGKNYLVQTPNASDIIQPISTSRTNVNIKAKTLIPFFKYKVSSHKSFRFLNQRNKQKTEYSNSSSKLTKKKLNTATSFSSSHFVTKNGVTNLFENSKNKELFVHLFKKQILAILTVKMSGRKVADSTYWQQYPGHIPLFLTKTKALFVDAVFMPVTKVNYILEESRQKLLDSFDFDSAKELSTIYQQEKSEFGESSVDKSFVDFFALGATKNQEQKKSKNSQGDRPKDKRKKDSKNKNESGLGSNSTGLDPSGERSGSLSDNSLVQVGSHTETSSSMLESETEQRIKQTKTELALYFKKNWLDSKESWLLFSSEFNSSLFDDFNQFPKDIIILEIWTNGSILPRTALKQAAQNLSNLFVKFENAKIMGNTFVETNKTYSQTIQQLYERYKKL
jgi:DNA-directed RNA polymerase alpha subunit